MTPAERVDYIIENLCHGSAKEFCTLTTINAAAVSRLRAGTLGYGAQGIGPYFERIATAFPDIDPNWLATGKGKPLGDSRNMVSQLLKEVRSLERKVERLAKAQGIDV